MYATKKNNTGNKDVEAVILIKNFNNPSTSPIPKPGIINIILTTIACKYNAFTGVPSSVSFVIFQVIFL